MRHAWFKTGAGQSPWERVVGNETGEGRTKARCVEVCILILSLQWTDPGTRGQGGHFNSQGLSFLSLENKEG